jgi:hypothetical protein
MDGGSDYYQGHSINDDYRLCGLRGDDKSDLEADWEELFGRASPPIYVDDDDDAAGDAATGDAVGGDATGDVGGAESRQAVVDGAYTKNKKCKNTSDTWNDFENINGKQVRTDAKCFHCEKYYAARSCIGTGHLNRHVRVCSKRKKSIRQSQSLLSFNADGHVHHWEYSADVARTQLCYLIARLDLPLRFGESTAFEEYIKVSHNPRFFVVSKQTTTRDFTKYFNDCGGEIINSLSSISSVAISFDIWSGNVKEDNLSVFAHYVNVDWQLEKRIIGFRLIDESHTGHNIAECVIAVLREYALLDKIFSHFGQCIFKYHCNYQNGS